MNLCANTFYLRQHEAQCERDERNAECQEIALQMWIEDLICNDRRDRDDVVMDAFASVSEADESARQDLALLADEQNDESLLRIAKRLHRHVRQHARRVGIRALKLEIQA